MCVTLCILVGLLVAILPYREAKQYKPVHGVCQPGFGLLRTHFNTTCSPCGTGSFSIGNTSVCLPCQFGFASTTMAATSCHLCSVNFYATPDKRQCINCADSRYNEWADSSGFGWVTAGPGATSLGQCFDLDLAMIFGCSMLLFVCGFAIILLFEGYVHTIALFRKLRVTQACARIMRELRNDVDTVLKDPRFDDEGDEEEDEAEADDWVIHDARRQKRAKTKKKTKRHLCVKMAMGFAQRVCASTRAVLFIVFGAAFALFATMLAFIFQLTHVFFQGILMFRVLGDPAAASQLAAFMTVWASGVSLVLPFVGKVLTGPILTFLEFLLTLTIDLDFSGLGINCYGAMAPFELLLNLTLFCIAVVVAQGDSCVLFSPLKSALLDKYAHLLHASRARRRFYGVRAALLVGLLVLGPLSNPVLPLVQYLLTLVTMNVFFSAGYHRTNPVCDARTMSGTVNGDYTLAFFTSAVTYACMFAVTWVAAKVLCPKDAPELIRKRVERFRKGDYPRCCWHDDGIDVTQLDASGQQFEKRTWTQFVVNNVASTVSAVGVLFAVGFAYVDAVLYIAFFAWARAVALKTADVDASVPRTRDRLLQLFHAVRIPSRRHVDWKYVDHALGRQLPSFSHFYRLWVCPRPLRRLKGRRQFPTPRAAPLPDLHLLGWRDVVYRLFAFLKTGLIGWDASALREMRVVETADDLLLREVLDECPGEYFRDLCASILIPRATLLRFFPQLTPLAFFIQQMATSPLALPTWPLETLPEPEYITTGSGAPSTPPKKPRIVGTLRVATDTSTLGVKPAAPPLFSPSGLWSGSQRLLRGLPSPTTVLSSPYSSPDSSPTRSPMLPPSPASAARGSQQEVDEDALQWRAPRERRKRKRDHHQMLAYLETQLHEDFQAAHVPPQWPQYLSAPYRLLHTPVLPTAWWLRWCSREPASSARPFADQGTETGTGTLGGHEADAAGQAAVPPSFAGFTWRYLVNLGNFILALWLAFGFSGFASPGLRGVLIFLSFAALLPLAFAVSLRALIPVGHFLGVQDDDFLPLKGIFRTCQACAWDGSSKASVSTPRVVARDSLVSSQAVSPSGVGVAVGARPSVDDMDVDVDVGDVEGGQQRVAGGVHAHAVIDGDSGEGGGGGGFGHYADMLTRGGPEATVLPFTPLRYRHDDDEDDVLE